jgi:hypothetical protein
MDFSSGVILGGFKNYPKGDLLLRNNLKRIFPRQGFYPKPLDNSVPVEFSGGLTQR